MKVSLMLACSAAALFSAATMAGPTRIDCPKEIKVTESVATVENSWSATRNEAGRYLLDTVLVYWGHPRRMGNLIGEETTKRHLKEISTWNLAASEKEEYWVACSYTNSLTLLTKALPKEYKKCELTVELLPTGAKLRIESFVCE
jgi:hypothetical protein